MSQKAKFKAQNSTKVPNSFFDEDLKNLSLDEIKKYLTSLREKGSTNTTETLEVEHE